MNDWKRLSICITPEEHKKFRVWAASRGISVSTLVRCVLNLTYDKAKADLEFEDGEISAFLKGLEGE